MTRHRFNVLGVCCFAAALSVLLFVDTHPTAGGAGAPPMLEALAASSYGLFGPDCPDAVPVCVKNPQLEVVLAPGALNPVRVTNKVPVFVNNDNTNPVPVAIKGDIEVTVNNPPGNPANVRVFNQPGFPITVAIANHADCAVNYEVMVPPGTTCTTVPNPPPPPAAWIIGPITCTLLNTARPLCVTNVVIRNGLAGPVPANAFSLVNMTNTGSVHGPVLDDILGGLRTVGNDTTAVSYSTGVIAEFGLDSPPFFCFSNSGNVTAVVEIVLNCEGESTQ